MAHQHHQQDSPEREIHRRQLVHTTENGKRRCYSCNHCFAQIVFCGDCSEFFRRVHWNNRGCKSIVWRCCSRLEATGHVCHARAVNEEFLKEVTIEAINQVLCKKDDFLNTLQANIATVVKQGNTLSPEVIDERLREMRKQAELDSVIKDEQMRLIMKITVFEDHFTVGFKSGITIDIEA